MVDRLAHRADQQLSTSVQQLSTSVLSWASQASLVLVRMLCPGADHDKPGNRGSQPTQADDECSGTAATSGHKTGQPSLHTLTNTLCHRCIPSQKLSVTGTHQAVHQITAVRQPTWSSQAWVVDCAASGSSLMACSSCATAELEMVAWKGATGHKEKSEPSEHTKSTWSIAQLGSECQHEAMPLMCSLNGRWHDKLYTV